MGYIDSVRTNETQTGETKMKTLKNILKSAACLTLIPVLVAVNLALYAVDKALDLIIAGMKLASAK